MKHQSNHVAHLGGCAALVLVAVFSAGCTIHAVREAPIEDKSSAGRPAKAAAPATTAPTTGAPAAVVTQREASNGTYVVQRGDTLYSIAVAFGQDHRDIARWNNLDDPTKIAVGQPLRVSPPEGDSAAVVGVVTVNPSAAIETRPLDAVPQAATPAPLPPAPGTTAPPVGVTTSPPPPAPVTPPAAPGAKPQAAERPSPTPPVAATGAALLWQWPAKGKVTDGFDESRNKGIDIAGAEGDAVLAASDGEVVYSGSNLRMYGNLVIIKHNDDYISAYAHNKQILVKQGQPVRRGQRIADLGKTDDGQARLHFQIRYRGKPVDPMKFLPPR
jgi:lipoprotein NlpD